MLSRSDFVPYAPDSVGEQVRINHDNCTAGTDTKRRLYIKRLTDGTILAYCHNCSESGHHRSKVRSIHAKPASITGAPKDIRMPNDCIIDTSLWPKEAVTWLYRYGITNQEIKDRGLAYSPKYGRVCFPLYNLGDYIGWQGRSLDELSNPPKYLTMVDRGRTMGNCATVSSGGFGQESVVLVEDMLSAIKVASQGIDACCTLGTNPTDEVVNQISKLYKKAYIWYDNDKPEVKEAQTNLYRLLGTLLNGNVELILTDRDPKEHSDDQIKCLLKRT